ncbi:MAG: alpha/beta hydrolase [Micrococcales bacterium]
MAYVLINHGWTNHRPQGHWQRLTAAALRAQGHTVAYPQYPSPDQPKFSEWSALLGAELELLAEARVLAGGTGEFVVLAHSLGCVTWLKSAIDGLLPESIKPDRLLLVAPAANEMLDPIPDFKVDLKAPGAAEAARKSAGQITLVGSDRDVWTPQGVQHHFGEPLALEAVTIFGAKHLALGDGWGNWQGVVNWVNDASADLTVR